MARALCSIAPHGFGHRSTTQQRNTHNIESREVRYPWHPWCGRVAAVHQTFAKNGRVVSRCGIEENAEARHLEIPEWMFDPVICRRMHLAAVPTVSGEALLDLKSLLRCAPFPDTDVVLQPQHRSLLSPGGADAKITRWLFRHPLSEHVDCVVAVRSFTNLQTNGRDIPCFFANYAAPFWVHLKGQWRVFWLVSYAESARN